MGKWLKIRVLGSGSYGTVFQAISAAPQRDYGKRIAMKSSRADMSYSLQKEECILKSFFGCREILQCYGSQITIEDGVLVYNLLLEFAPYGTLANLIQKEPFLESEVKVYTRMLLKGLSCIHQRGLVHCDLKPENILVFPSSQYSASYQLKIADFGLSRTCEENFNGDYWKFKFRGTPSYMSPESIVYGQIEPPLDIWSLGCIIIEMITGLPVSVWWNLYTKYDIVFKVGVQEKALEMPNGVSRDCIDFLSKCFMRNPSERWTANMLLNHPFILF